MSDDEVPSLVGDPLWSDIVPLPQDDGPSPVVSILYTPQFTLIMDYFRAILKADERSIRAIQLTQYVIKLNPANYTAWYFRRLCLEANHANLEDELAFVAKCALESPKNYQLWQHRRWILGKLADSSKELAHTAEILSMDSKNYHAWAHRQWAIKTFNLWDNELAFTEKLLNIDARNNSAWNQRFFILKHQKMTVDVVRNELKTVFDFIKKAPSNKSPWNFLLGLLAEVEFNKSIVGEVYKFSREICASDSKCVPSLEMLIELFRNGASEETKPKVTEYCDVLQTVDPIRSSYWAFVGQSL